jgi:hypothetical protein
MQRRTGEVVFYQLVSLFCEGLSAMPCCRNPLCYCFQLKYATGPLRVPAFDVLGNIRAGPLELTCWCFRTIGSNGWLLLLRARLVVCDHASRAKPPPRTQQVRIRSGTLHRQPSTGPLRSVMLITWRGVQVNGLLLRSFSDHRG